MLTDLISVVYEPEVNIETGNVLLRISVILFYVHGVPLHDSIKNSMSIFCSIIIRILLLSNENMFIQFSIFVPIKCFATDFMAGADGMARICSLLRTYYVVRNNLLNLGINLD